MVQAILFFMSSPSGMILDNHRYYNYTYTLAYEKETYKFTIADSSLYTDKKSKSVQEKKKNPKINVRYAPGKSGYIKLNPRTVRDYINTNFSMKLFSGKQWIWERNENLGYADIYAFDFDGDKVDELVILPRVNGKRYPIQVYKSKYSGRL